jgi:hypothetical protein
LATLTYDEWVEAIMLMPDPDDGGGDNGCNICGNGNVDRSKTYYDGIAQEELTCGSTADYCSGTEWQAHDGHCSNGNCADLEAWF